MKKLLLLSALLAGPASAGFEGVLTMKFTAPRSNGEAKMYLSKQGVRNETVLQAAQTTMKFTTLILNDRPGVVSMIDDQRKTYFEMPVKPAPAGAEKGFSVKNLGEETVHGYRCRHVLIVHPRGGESEMWTTRELMDYDTFARARSTQGRDEGQGLMKALKDAGADGFPVKSIHRAGHGKEGEMVMELVNAEAKSLPDSLFRVPPGYGKSNGPPTAPVTADRTKAMEEAVKNMTPQQREMLQKMMKGKNPK